MEASTIQNDEKSKKKPLPTLFSPLNSNFLTRIHDFHVLRGNRERRKETQGREEGTGHRAPGTGDQESKKRAHGKRKETGERSIGDQMTRVKISDVEAWHRLTERRIHQGKREREGRRTGGRRAGKKANDRAGGQTSGRVDKKTGERTSGSPPYIRCSLLPEKLSDKLTHACRKGVLPP